MRYRKQLLLFISILTVDRLTKSWALNNLPASLYFNHGISFSIFGDVTYAGLFFSLLALVLLLLVCRRRPELRKSVAMAFLFAGSAGNLADRLLYGYVVDWLFVGVYINLADISLCLGFAVLLCQVLKRSRSN